MMMMMIIIIIIIITMIIIIIIIITMMMIIIIIIITILTHIMFGASLGLPVPLLVPHRSVAVGVTSQPQIVVT